MTPNAFRRVPLRVTRQLDYPEFSCRPIRAMSLRTSAFVLRTAPRYKWPDCDPIDKTDEFWEFNNNFTCNGTPYKKEEVTPGRWQWVVDNDSVQSLREAQQRKDDLWWALRTRVLTAEEMQEVRSHGYHLLTRNMQSYREDDIRREFNEALTRQAYLRMDAEKASGMSASGQDREAGFEAKPASPTRAAGDAQ